MRPLHSSAGVVEGFEGLAEVVWEWVGGGVEVLAGLDLDCAVAACGLCESPELTSLSVPRSTG
jgi:hypothetical protein